MQQAENALAAYKVSYPNPNPKPNPDADPDPGPSPKVSYRELRSLWLHLP